MDVTTILEEAGDHKVGWDSWVVGLAFITACSFSAPLALLFLPCFPKTVYERLMAFLVALGIGTLSGSCIFILIPEAFQVTDLIGLGDYRSKSGILIGSLYGFFLVDRLLQYVLEWRRRKNTHRMPVSQFNRSMKKSGKSVHTVNDDKLERQSTTSSENGTDESMDSPPNELEVSLRHNIVARTLSTRHTVAVVRVNSVECNEDGQPSHLAPKGSKRLTTRSLRHLNRDLEKMSDFQHHDIPHHDSVKSTASSKKIFPEDKEAQKEDEVEFSVQVLEKRVVDNAEMEIASIAYIIILGQSANNFLDGMNTGASFGASFGDGVSLGISAFCGQFPQELGLLAILSRSGLGVKKAMLVNLIPTGLSYLGFVIGILLNNIGDSYEHYVFCVSSGMYLYVFLGTLIPEIREEVEELVKTNLRESIIVNVLQGFGIAAGVLIMFGLTYL